MTKKQQNRLFKRLKSDTYLRFIQSESIRIETRLIFIAFIFTHFTSCQPENHQICAKVIEIKQKEVDSLNLELEYSKHNLNALDMLTDSLIHSNNSDQSETLK